MKAYILSIAGAVLLSAVVAIISPGGKMGKFIKGATKLLILFVMVSPIADWLKRKDFSFGSMEIGEDAGYLAYCAEELCARDEEEIASFLAETYSISAEIDVKRSAESGFPRKNIAVYLKIDGIIGQDQHIDIMTSVREALTEKYSCAVVVS